MCGSTLPARLARRLKSISVDTLHDLLVRWNGAAAVNEVVYRTWVQLQQRLEAAREVRGDACRPAGAHLTRRAA
jgi:hypothetical protein